MQVKYLYAAQKYRCVAFVSSDKPYFPSEVPTEVVVIEKQPSTVNATAIGNPADIVYSWYRGSDKLALGLPRFHLNGGAIEARSGFERSDAGTYTCVAQNAEGLTQHDIVLNVHCKWDVFYIQQLVTPSYK